MSCNACISSLVFRLHVMIHYLLGSSWHIEAQGVGCWPYVADLGTKLVGKKRLSSCAAAI